MYFMYIKVVYTCFIKIIFKTIMFGQPIKKDNKLKPIMFLSVERSNFMISV